MKSSQVIVLLKNDRSRIFGLPQKNYLLVRRVCGWKEKNYFFTDRFQKNKKWDGYTSLLTKKGFFPTGIADILLDQLKRIGLNYKLIDKRTTYEYDFNEEKLLSKLDNLNMLMRSYQIDGLLTGLQNNRMLFQWPTASGKSVLFALLIYFYNLRTLIIVNRKELMTQLAREISDKTGLEVGVIGDGKWNPKRVTVAIVDSLVSRLKDPKVKQFLEHIRYFIADESHHLAATEWKKVAYACNNAVIKHGFSGTCFRTDSKDILLVATTGSIKHKITTSELIKQGWLSRPEITMCYVDGFCGSKNWVEIERELIVTNRIRNYLACGFIKYHYEQNRQILVIVNKIKHGKIIYESLCKEFNISSKEIKYVTGTHQTFFREKVLRDFRNRKLPILIGTSIYEEGVDLPSADVGVNLAGGDSEIKTIQRLGRILRKTKGEYDIDIDEDKPQTVYYLDFIDRGHEFTYHHSRHRQEVYEAEEEFKVIKTNGEKELWYPRYKLNH